MIVDDVAPQVVHRRQDDSGEPCLGDWCTALHCNFFAHAAHGSEKALCREPVVRQHRIECKVLI